MAEEFQTYFAEIMSLVEGANAIVVSDREGVIVLQARALTVQDHQVKPSMLSTAPASMEQASKLSLGPAKTVVCFSESNQMISFNCAPLTVTVLADRTANTGQILSLEADLKAAAELMKPVVESEIP